MYLAQDKMSLDNKGATYLYPLPRYFYRPYIDVNPHCLRYLAIGLVPVAAIQIINAHLHHRLVDAGIYDAETARAYLLEHWPVDGRKNRRYHPF